MAFPDTFIRVCFYQSFFFSFFEIGLTIQPGLPETCCYQTKDPPASASQGLGFQACMTTPGYSYILIISGCINHDKSGRGFYTHETLESLYGNAVSVTGTCQPSASQEIC
jgi:hypothetical protein